MDIRHEAYWSAGKMHRHGNAVAKRHVADFVGAENSPGPAMSRTSPEPYTSWFVSIRIIAQGLGPGLTTMAYRMSVILRVDGLG